MGDEMEQKTYCVYQHTNKTNGKIYIGITCQKPEIRWGSRGQKYQECPYFWNAIQKYGWDNFDHEILFSGQSHEEACDMEVKLIKEKKSNDPDYGYNQSRGGDGFDSELSRKLWQDPDYKAFASERMREAWKDPEKRKRRSDTAKQRWANDSFKKSTMQKVIEACRAPVMCVETGEVFETMKEAADAHGVDKANICRSCKTHYRCGGYHWKYVDDVS